MYAVHGSSVTQHLVLTMITATCLAVAWWLLFGDGIVSIDTWLGWALNLGDNERRLCLGVALSIYFVRLLFTQFVFLERAVSWGEACMVGVWIACIYLLFAIAGGTNPVQPNALLYLGVALFVAGSWMNSYAEYARRKWKQRPENHGRLYTLGPFRYCRHPNYLGDVISFAGICLISGLWVCALIPIAMLLGFVFVNIPILDSHLRRHYGAAFDEYAARTPKLIPFVY